MNEIADNATLLMVAVIGGAASIWAAWITVKQSKTSKELSKTLSQLSELYSVVKQPSEEYSWLYDKYMYLDSAFDGYCVINPLKNEEYISDNICRIIGRRRSEIGKTVETLRRFVYQVDFDAFEMMVRNLMDRKMTKADCTKRILMSDGRWARFAITAVLDGPFILTIWRFEGHEKGSVFE